MESSRNCNFAEAKQGDAIPDFALLWLSLPILSMPSAICLF